MTYILRSMRYPTWKVPLGITALYIGRSANNQLVPRDRSVSRRHAMIKRESGGYILTDLGSKAGTLVNGMRVMRYEVKAGDIISFGADQWRVEWATGQDSRRGAAAHRRQNRIWVGIIGAAAVLLVFALGLGSSSSQPAYESRGTAKNTPEVMTTPAPNENPYLKPVARFPAVVGHVMTAVPPVASWHTVSNPGLGVSFDYPPDWTYQETADKSAALLYPPQAETDSPSALISFAFLAEHPFDRQKPLIPGKSTFRPITVNGIEGIQYQDDEFSVPTQTYYIELPLKKGTLFITATQGPITNLVPQLLEILDRLEAVS